VICPQCGADLTEKASKSPSCLEPLDAKPIEHVEPESLRAAPSVVYAGFWWRALAFVIDSVSFFFVVTIVVLMPMLKHAGIPLDNPWVLTDFRNRQVVAINLAIFMAMWLFWSAMESSAWQATPGKRMLGIYVTDLAGKRITFARACGRFFAGHGISFIPLVGTIYYFSDCLMAGITVRKQAAHDAIAGCLVLRRVKPAAREAAG